MSHWCRISQVITRHIHEYLLLVASLSAYVNQAQLLLLSSLQNPSFVESNWRIGMLNQERLYICCSIAPDPRRQPNDSRRHYGALQFLPMLPPPWCDASEVPINCHPIYILSYAFHLQPYKLSHNATSRLSSCHFNVRDAARYSGSLVCHGAVPLQLLGFLG